MSDSMTKEQFAASFIQALKHGTRIATGKEQTVGDAHELMNRLRSEIEDDKRERRKNI
jgi:hypothetical protein